MPVSNESPRDARFSMTNDHSPTHDAGVHRILIAEDNAGLASLQVRGISHDGVDRGIDVHVSRVRRKLDAQGFDFSMLKSIRFMGYLFVKR
jgi:hypothetical protein